MRLVCRDEWVCCLCCALLGVYVAPFFENPSADGDWEFLTIWDDKTNFVENAAIQHGLSWSNVYEMFTMTKVNVYEPFGWLLKAITVCVVGLDPWSVRVVSVLLHFVSGFVLAKASALLLDVVAVLSNFKLGAKRYGDLIQDENRRHWYGCCLSTTVFLIHPVHVEVISWPSAQPYTLCALFSNLALYVHIRAIAQRLSDVSTKKDVEKVLFPKGFSGDSLLCCGLYLSALLSKSACILLPASFVLIDALVYAALRFQMPKINAKQLWSYMIGKLPMTAVFLSFLTITLLSNRRGAQADADVLLLSLNERFVKVMTTPVWILKHLLWPTKLRPHYQLHQGDLDFANAEQQLAIAASILLVLMVVWLLENRNALQHLLALINFVVMLLPVSGLVQHGMVSAGFDRYAYLTTIVTVPYGGAALAQWVFDDDEEEVEPEHSPRQSHHQPSKPKKQKGIIFVLYLLLSGALLLISTGLMRHWRNENALLKYSLRMDPSDWRILDQRATYLTSAGRCSPDDSECHQLWELSYYFTPKGTLKSDLHRLKLLVSFKQIDRACEAYMELVKLHPHSCHAHNNAGVCWVHLGDLDKARQEFEYALQTPGYEHVHEIPRSNLKRFGEWVALKERVRASGGAEQVPQFNSQIMF